MRPAARRAQGRGCPGRRLPGRCGGLGVLRQRCLEMGEHEVGIEVPPVAGGVIGHRGKRGIGAAGCLEELGAVGNEVPDVRITVDCVVEGGNGDGGLMGGGLDTGEIEGGAPALGVEVAIWSATALLNWR